MNWQCVGYFSLLFFFFLIFHCFVLFFKDVKIFLHLLYRTSSIDFKLNRSIRTCIRWRWFTAESRCPWTSQQLSKDILQSDWWLEWMSRPAGGSITRLPASPGFTSINSARMLAIANPSIYCSLWQGGGGGEISNMSTQSSFRHEGRTVVALKGSFEYWPQPRRLSARWYEPVEADGCTGRPSTPLALIMWAAGGILG